jgi:hypothetical protein
VGLRGVVEPHGDWLAVARKRERESRLSQFPQGTDFALKINKKYGTGLAPRPFDSDRLFCSKAKRLADPENDIPPEAELYCLAKRVALGSIETHPTLRRSPGPGM